MERKIYQSLINWKNSKDRKPLILQGARQVGKTYIVNIFGSREYSNTVYLNFEKEKDLSSFFDDLTPERIVEKIANLKRKEIVKEHTLIIFDEIQACPNALTSLKYFCEEANGYHIIALGSLLGVAVNRNNYSFPVGKVDMMTMYPLDFEEYLLANGEEYLISEIRKCYENDSPMDQPFHEKALNLYREYLYVGGMPEAVQSYVTNRNPDLVRLIQQNIIDSYLNDMGEYNNKPGTNKTRLIYNKMGGRLSKENRKFRYADLKSGGRASDFETSAQWLCLSGIANRLYRLKNVSLPLKSNQSESDFKFYMNDVGLLCADQNILYNDIMFENPLVNDFKGGLTENYVNNQFISNNLKAYYWTSKNEAEVDFVTRIKEDIIPIEVKSSDNTRSRSLNIYVQRYSPSYSIRISSRNFGYGNNIKSVPLYAVFCIK